MKSPMQQQRKSSKVISKTVILGISGAIAAYKAADLASTLKQAGHKVQAVMTANALRFITAETLYALTGNPVITTLFKESSQPIPHISITESADLVILAPATANLIGKIANGIADDILTSTVMASTAPKLVVPTMNVEMWKNPLLQRNLKTLQEVGYHIVEPAEGWLACGTVGKGRYPDNKLILEQASKFL